MKKIPAGQNAESIRELQKQVKALQEELYFVKCILTGGARASDVYEGIFTLTYTPTQHRDKDILRD